MSDLKEKAKQFAINAHRGQVRKNETEKPMILHPLNVGRILESHGYDDEIIAAGYLHDVVEDTKYSFEDIESTFGSEVTRLVKNASELDKTLPWIERKKRAIESTRDLSLKDKLVICADKIDNLEDLRIKFQKNSERNFDAFNCGEEQQKWYYTEMFKSLIHGQDEKWPIFKTFKDNLDRVFYGKEDNYLKDTIFNGNQNGYSKRMILQAQKEELLKLKRFSNLQTPFVIEFTGTPRTGKTTAIQNITDFFTKGGFKVDSIEEFTTSKYYKEQVRPFYKPESKSKLHVAIQEEVSKQLKEARKTKSDVIVIDRSLNDRQIWNDRGYLNGDIQEELYQELQQRYAQESKEMIDFLVLTYADPITALKRDYQSSLALENRRFLNEQNINEYNNSLKRMLEFMKTSVGDSLYLDTTTKNMEETSLEIASHIVLAMRKRYLNNINQIYR